MNKTLSDLMTRRSVRNFDSRPVDRKDLETIIAAGLSAPSAGGQKPWHVVVIEDKTTREKIKSVMQWFQPIVESPVAILVCGDPSVCVYPEYWPVDCAALSENILLAARALDLGSVWCGIAPVESNAKAIRSVLDIPAPFEPFGMIAIGYPSKSGAFHERNAAGDDKRVSWNPDWLKEDAR